MPKKPGYMTTEILVTFATLWAIYKTLGVAVAIEGGCNLGLGVAVAGGAIGMGIAALGYSESRGKSKGGAA